MIKSLWTKVNELTAQLATQAAAAQKEREDLLKIHQTDREKLVQAAQTERQSIYQAVAAEKDVIRQRLEHEQDERRGDVLAMFREHKDVMTVTTKVMQEVNAALVESKREIEELRRDLNDEPPRRGGGERSRT